MPFTSSTESFGSSTWCTKGLPASILPFVLPIPCAAASPPPPPPPPPPESSAMIAITATTAMTAPTINGVRLFPPVEDGGADAGPPPGGGLDGTVQLGGALDSVVTAVDDDPAGANAGPGEPIGSTDATPASETSAVHAAPSQ